MSDWRLFCPDCERRTFHDEVSVPGGSDAIQCRACGSTDRLERRKATSREVDRNPDQEQFKLPRWSA